MDWLKLNTKGILRGSLARSDSVTQLIWIKLLAMASETRDRDGYLRYKPGEPYSYEFISLVCNVTLNELEIAIDDFEEDIRDGHSRISFAEDGSIRINNWDYYQTQPADVDAPPRIKKSAEQQEKTVRSYVRHNPEVATDELVHLSEEIAEVRHTQEDIDKLRDKAINNQTEE